MKEPNRRYDNAPMTVSRCKLEIRYEYYIPLAVGQIANDRYLTNINECPCILQISSYYFLNQLQSVGSVALIFNSSFRRAGHGDLFSCIFHRKFD